MNIKDLGDYNIEVSVDVSNIGNMKAKETVLLFVNKEVDNTLQVVTLSNNLEELQDETLLNETNEIKLDSEIIEKARLSIDKMLELSIQINSLNAQIRELEEKRAPLSKEYNKMLAQRDRDVADAILKEIYA